MSLQDSSTSGANVKRLESESSAAVKNIEKSIASKEKEVGCPLTGILMPYISSPCAASSGSMDANRDMLLRAMLAGSGCNRGCPNQ